jgi:MoaA/NifB/PqqE/SkfB family radical SAM enzyme
VILTGGEPFLRDDLAAVATAYARGARPAVLAIPTNGGRPEAILATVDRILGDLPPGTTLSVNVSLDGPGPLHDSIRAVPGLHRRAVRTLAGLKARARAHPSLTVGVISVVSQANAHALGALEEHVLDELGIASWAPFLVRGRPRDASLDDPPLQAYRALSGRLEARARAGAYRDTAGFLGARVNRAKNVVRRRIIAETTRSGRRQVACGAGRLSAVIQSDGALSACELLDAPMGGLREHDYDLGVLWRSAAAARVRERVDRDTCACTHENSLTMSIAYDPRSWMAMLAWLLAWERGVWMPRWPR